MNRKERINKKLHNAGITKGHLTEEEVDRILDEYIKGAKNQFRGDTIVNLIERFFEHVPDARRRFNDSADELLELDRKNKNRFRNKVLIALLLAYQNGTVDGHKNGGGYDLAGTIKRVQEELDESPKYKLS